MKKLSIAVAITLSSIVGSVYADTQTVPVTASIAGVCKFSGTIATVAFGLIDPSTTGTKTQPLAFAYRCTKGTTASLSLGTITPMAGATAPADSIPFAVAALPAGVLGTGFGTGSTATNVSVLVSILQADYQNVKADAYSGSVVVNIAP